MSAFETIIKKTTSKFRHGMATYYLLGRLKSIGLNISPYFLEREFHIPASDLPMDITPRIDPLTTDFLAPREIETLIKHPERASYTESYSMQDRITDGCLCFGIKYREEIIAYTWCDLQRCNHQPLQFDLKKTEAYLFDMYTFKAYRGKNIAPYMRHQLYSHLQDMDRTDFFSITEALNNASVRFKRKLGARPIKLYLYFKAGKHFERNILLKRYQ